MTWRIDSQLSHPRFVTYSWSVLRLGLGVGVNNEIYYLCHLTSVSGQSVIVCAYVCGYARVNASFDQMCASMFPCLQESYQSLCVRHCFIYPRRSSDQVLSGCDRQTAFPLSQSQMPLCTERVLPGPK